MAYDINIGQTQAIVRVRRPWAVVLLSILTLGVYSAVWYYKVNREMRDYGSACGDSELAESKPVRSALAVTIGSVFMIPVFVSYVRMVGRLQRVERIVTGGSRAGAGLIALLIGSTALSFLAALAGTSVLELLGATVYLTAYALIQSRLNAVWKQRGAVAGPTVVNALDTTDRGVATAGILRARGHRLAVHRIGFVLVCAARGSASGGQVAEGVCLRSPCWCATADRGIRKRSTINTATCSQ